jgi:hypothetical protein
VSLDLGPLNIFVGTNASGKTNFLEALRVLQGIGHGYTVDEILNGKPKGANSEVWEYMKRYGEALAQLAKWYREGRLKYRETVAEGIENAIPAFLGMLRGENIGKQLVRISNL